MNRLIACFVLLCVCLSSSMTVGASVHTLKDTSATESNHDCHHDNMTVATELHESQSHDCCEQDSNHTCSGKCCDCDSGFSALINGITTTTPSLRSARVAYSTSFTSPPETQNIIPPIQ